MPFAQPRSSPADDLDGLRTRVAALEEENRQLRERSAEPATGRSEATLTALIAASPLAIVALTADGCITLWNRAAERVFGWAADEVIGKELPFIPAERRDEHRAMRVQDLTGEGFVGRPIRRLRKDGTVIDLSVSTAPMRDTAGRVGGILSVYQDVTAERQAAAALQASEERYRSLVAATSQIVWTTAADGTITPPQPGWTAFTGQTDAEMTGVGWLNAIHPADRAHTLAAWAEATRTRSLYAIEHRLRRQDGAYRHMQVRAVPIIDAQGTVREWVGVHADITERVQAEAALRDSHAALQMANKDLEQIAYSAGHDLREPLRTVGSYATLLERRYGPRLDADAREFLGYIADGAERMQQLLQDLLAYARVAHAPGVSQALTVPVDLNQVLDRVRLQLRSTLAESGAVLEADSLPTVAGDATQLALLLQNLIGNALKYRKPGEHPHVTVAAERDGLHWRVSVRDRGMGFAPEHAGRIFGLFRRLHGRDIPGTGIGLAIAHRIVERCGGRIWAESDGEGHGATFCFTLKDAPGDHAAPEVRG